LKVESLKNDPSSTSASRAVENLKVETLEEGREAKADPSLLWG
jgi:hypothetical protein